MMRKVFKYPLPPLGGALNHQVPEVGKPVHVDVQNGVPTVWVEVETTAPLVYWTFLSIGTGWEVPPGGQHIGTLIDGAGFVWHHYAVRS